MPNFTSMTQLLSAPLVGAALLAALGGCSSADIPGVYRIDIQQGNVVTQDMLNQLEAGMDQRKVRFVLGTPMLTDTFNDDRWDYIYSYQEGGGERVQRRVSVYFEGQKLSHVDGDVRRGQSRTPVVARKETLVTVPPNPQSEGFLSALKPDFLKPKKKPRQPIEQTAAPVEPAAETQAAAAPEAAAPTGAGAATAAATPSGPTVEDQAYLKELFKGFGAPAVSGVTPGATGEVIGGGSPTAASVGNELDGSGSDPDAADPADGETSYLRRLLKQLREAGTPSEGPAGGDGLTSPRETAAP